MRTFVYEANIIFDLDIDSIRTWWNSNCSLVSLATNANVKSFDEMDYMECVNLTKQTSDLMKRLLSYYTL